MQHFLKPPRGSARAWVVATEALEELLVAVHDAVTALDVGLGRETVAPFAGALESKARRDGRSVSWRTSAGLWTRGPQAI
jgi:hypothetical protein